MQLKLDEQDQYRLDKLAEMINVASNYLRDNPISRSKLNIKQDLLSLTLAPVNNYSEAIFVLCKDFRPDAAKVLLRPLVEAYINIAYLLSHNGKNRSRKFVVEDNFYSLGLINQAIEFYNRYPDLRPKADEFKSEALGKLSKKLQADLESNAIKLKLKSTSKRDFKRNNPEVFDLLSRARALDRKNMKGAFEYWYLMIYRYFSEYTHLSMKGISHFFTPTPYGFDANFSQSPKGSGIILLTTYHIYLFFLEKLKQYKLSSLDIKPFQLEYKKLWDNFNDPLPPLGTTASSSSP